MGGSFSFGQETPQPSRCQVPELREAWHWQMPYAFAQEQLVVEIFVSWIYLRSTPGPRFTVRNEGLGSGHCHLSSSVTGNLGG